MAKLSISKAWDETSGFLARHGRLVVAVALALIVLPAVVIGVLAPQTMNGSPPDGMIGLLWLVVTVIGFAGRLAIIRLSLGPATSVGDAIGQGFRHLPWVLGALIIFLLPITLLLAPFLPQVLASPENPPPGPAAMVLLIFLLAFAAGARLVSMVMPIAVAERGGSIALLTKSWRMTRGNWWRLIGFLLVYFMAAAVALRAIGFALGPVLMLSRGRIEPMTLRALIFSIVVSSASALFVVILTVMLARIYAQLAAPVATVPEVSREGE